MDVLYRDAWLLVLDKPSGLLAHRGRADDPETALDVARRAAGRRVFPVHRLDRGTSGALLYALDDEVAARLGAAFAAGEVDKRYLALVRGRPPDAGRIDHPVPRDEGGARVPAVTDFVRLGTAPVEGRLAVSLVEARPRTGRFHQVRRHLKHLGHPLVGDVNYGRGEINRLFRERFGLRRLALHARELTLVHPVTGERLAIASPLPADLAATLDALGLGG